MKARLVDLDWLKIVDTSNLALDAYGAVTGAHELVAKLKADKPFLFGKHARDMTETERAEAWAGFRREPKPAPMDMSKRAKDMSQREREAFLKECARRFG
jgi:hypothetical protein